MSTLQPITAEERSRQRGAVGVGGSGGHMRPGATPVHLCIEQGRPFMVVWVSARQFHFKAGWDVVIFAYKRAVNPSRDGLSDSRAGQ